IRLEEIRKDNERAEGDWIKIVEQLQYVRRKGHDIFPHLHPHWLDAIYRPDTNDWNLGILTRYRFHSLTLSERELLWRESIRILHSIIAPLDSNYQIDSYRAGGWCIQPFLDFKPFFIRYEITYDFSVRAGYKILGEAHSF